MHQTILPAAITDITRLVLHYASALKSSCPWGERPHILSLIIDALTTNELTLMEEPGKVLALCYNSEDTISITFASDKVAAIGIAVETFVQAIAIVEVVFEVACILISIIQLQNAFFLLVVFEQAEV